MNKIEVGKTYNTSAGEFTCIATTDTHAWMKSFDSSVGYSSVGYVWYINGKSVSLGADVIWPQPTALDLILETVQRINDGDITYEFISRLENYLANNP